MFKQRVNEVEITFSVAPVTPLLIKASDAGADPTRPDMEFVQTYHNGAPTIYLPGSSLKGAIRAQGERIVRTVGGDTKASSPWACNPLDNASPCRKKEREESYPAVYKRSCFTCRLFGSTESASHFVVGDAYPDDPSTVVVEERNGVAIDRKLGCASGGALFNLQVATAGRFVSRIRVSNFSLDQLGLIGLTIRDFDTQFVSLGFAKSRGLGQVSMTVESILIRYPGCILENEIKVLKTGRKFVSKKVIGAGALFEAGGSYGYPAEDVIDVDGDVCEDPLGIGVVQTFKGEAIGKLWKESVGAWKKQIKGGVAR
jgi:CRISPR-associated RAMP protein (TIGR02581 family)